jgi:hypothetical protein
MTEDLEIRRKACEALGWRLFFIGDGFLYHEIIPPSDPPFELEDDQVHLWEEVPFSQISDKVLQRCPPIESDPAASEPMFLEWCEKNGYWWNAGTCFDGSGQFYCNVGHRIEGPGTITNLTLATIDASTPSLARALAIIAASEKVKS